MSSTRHHLCVDIQGAKANWKTLVGAITLDNGKVLKTKQEIIGFLNECLDKGWRVLPCGDCDNFDYQKGCLGHPIPDDKTVKIETKHHEPIVYRTYEYLKEHHLGLRNGIQKPILADRLGVSPRELRKITREINTSTELEKLVSTTHCCYMCSTKEECEKSIRNTYNTAIALFKKAKQMEKKVGLNGQMKIKVGKYYKDFVQTFSEEE